MFNDIMTGTRLATASAASLGLLLVSADRRADPVMGSKRGVDVAILSGIDGELSHPRPNAIIISESMSTHVHHHVLHVHAAHHAHHSPWIFDRVG